jgi:protein ImuB
MEGPARGSWRGRPKDFAIFLALPTLKITLKLRNMPERFVSIWLPFLVTDWMARRSPGLRDLPFVLFAPERGRMIVKAVSRAARAKGIRSGMPVADCRAVFPDITVLDYPEGKAEQLLEALAIWCIRFAPVTAVDLPDGIVLNSSGCPHLWQGDEPYVAHILGRLEAFGYHAQAAISDTVASASAFARYCGRQTTVPSGGQMQALYALPPAALRLDQAVTARLEKLGLKTIGDFAHLPRPALLRRFGSDLLTRLDQAAGLEPEPLKPVEPPRLYLERLPALEPICTAKGIGLAVEQLLESLCERLSGEGSGLRNASLRCYRVDGDVQEVTIGTNLPTRNAQHLAGLFALKTGQLRPDLGFELFELQASNVEPVAFDQAELWAERNTSDTAPVAELLDKIIGKRGQNTVHRYMPAEHYWPERSYAPAASLNEVRSTEWRTDQPRPVHLLSRPQHIDVTVPLPDYPPMLFRYKGELHQVKKADGPERIEQEWWLQKGVYRDYYCVEDEKGRRYWIFRSGPYDGGHPGWFIHGFFA